MQDIFSLIEAVVPEFNAAFAQRLSIMRVLANADGRLGRKLLAERVGLTERSLRTAMTSLREQGLVDVASSGILLSNFGYTILDAIDSSLESESRFYELEQQMKHKLGVKHCRIVAGNADYNENVYTALGNMVNRLLADLLPDGQNIIAVTGGSTLAHIGTSLSPVLSRNRQLIFVPARGGVGGSYDIQSNTVGGMMSSQTHGQYVPLFLPENIGETTTRVLLDDPAISYAIHLSKQANCLLLSVGTASVMAKRYDIEESRREQIMAGQAIGEAFGVFFDQAGQEIMRLPRYGIQVEDLAQIKLPITIVGGAKKAEAVKAYYKLVGPQGYLVCDQGLANMVLNGESR